MNRLRYLLLAFLFMLLSTPIHAQQFGGSLAISGEDIIVSETRNRAFPGMVYVFQHNSESGEWEEAARLQASDNEGTADRFGHSLAADASTLLIGTPAGNSSTGTVYIYQRDESGNWSERSRLSADDGAESDAFGTSLLLTEEVAIVAATAQNEGTGAVYVFQRGSDGSWSQHSKLVGSDVQAGAAFGSALAIEGNVLLVGAPQKDEGTGAVYIFRQDASGTWTEEGKLETFGLSKGIFYGSTLAMQDGVALVGAPRFNQREGAVYVFQYDTENEAWMSQTRLAPFTAQRFGQFGAAISFDGSEVLIGASGDARLGSIYTFRRDQRGNWIGAIKRTSPRLTGRASFGSALALKGDLAVVGATGIDSGEGAALIFERDDQGRWQEKNQVVNEMKGYASILGGEVKCTDDKAAHFECGDVDLVSFLSIKDIGGKRGVGTNDIWGWTDPLTDREYALVGRTDGTSFVDVTDAHNPVYLGDLPKTEGSRASVWRDMKVYKDHVFIVADGANEHGMQIFDLTELRNITAPPVTFEATAHYDKIHSVHNIVINEDTGFAYAVGSSSGGETCGGGLHMINIEEPANPEFVGCFADTNTGRRGTGYSHDAQCVIYHGPDTEHQGKEICLGSNETAFSIADVTDKENPVAISVATYPKVAYSHQGWLTEDHTYFYMNDEGDEPSGLVEGTRTLVWDVSDLDDPILVKEHIAETTTTDHNLYIRGNLMYQSNYGSGLRILDIADPENPVEVGFFDTTPTDSGGSWSNYPYFKSGIIIATGMREGLFVLKKREVDL